MEVIVLEVDTDNRRISLGHKQIEDDPWQKYEATYVVGNDFEGTVKELFSKGALINLSQDVECFLLKTHRERRRFKINSRESLLFLEF